MAYDSYQAFDRPRRSRGRSKGPIAAVAAGAASIAVVAGAIAGSGHLLTARSTATATDNMNCALIVPANPLTAQGLATPYQLTATNPADGPCNESNPNQTAFVQGAVIDRSTGQISVYNTVVVDQGTQPAAMPSVPTLPANSVAALWFGFNGATLSFAGADQLSSTASSATAPTATSTTQRQPRQPPQPPRPPHRPAA